MLHIKRNTQLSARLAGAAFANDCQGRPHIFCNFLNQGLKTNGLCQIIFQARHINHPVQRLNVLLGSIEFQVAILIAFNVHFQNGGAGSAFWPATQVS